MGVVGNENVARHSRGLWRVYSQITHTEFGSAVTHSLKTDGENVPVTNDNRHGTISQCSTTTTTPVHYTASFPGQPG